tara:strand:+ start:1832 stop:2308 length:477 start_codon:yes stop_codon:yes gene_type:complete
MKITKTQLKKIIKEELGSVLNETQELWMSTRVTLGQAARDRVNQIDVHPYFTDNPNAYQSDRFRYALGAEMMHAWMYQSPRLGDIGRPPKELYIAGNTTSWFVDKVSEGAFDEIIKKVFAKLGENLSTGSRPGEAERFIYDLSGVQGDMHLYKFKDAR